VYLTQQVKAKVARNPNSHLVTKMRLTRWVISPDQMKEHALIDSNLHQNLDCGLISFRICNLAPSVRVVKEEESVNK